MLVPVCRGEACHVKRLGEGRDARMRCHILSYAESSFAFCCGLSLTEIDDDNDNSTR